jgi:hypothetical protein
MYTRRTNPLEWPQLEHLNKCPPPDWGGIYRFLRGAHTPCPFMHMMYILLRPAVRRKMLYGLGGTKVILPQCQRGV